MNQIWSLNLQLLSDGSSIGINSDIILNLQLHCAEEALEQRLSSSEYDVVALTRTSVGPATAI